MCCFPAIFTKKTVFYSYVRFPQRYCFALLGFLCMVISYAMRSTFNIAIIKMTSHPGDRNLTKEEVSEKDTFDWNEQTQGMILSAFYYGYLLTHLPGGVLAEKIGGKYTVGIGVTLTGLLTLLTPWAARRGPFYISTVRFLEGLGEGARFPAMNIMLAQWAPPLERSKMTTIVYSGALIGMMIGASFGGTLIELTGRWDLFFYILGTVAIAWFILWVTCAYENPSSHPFISDEERCYILETVGQLERRKDLGPTPWREMLRSPPLWSLILAAFGHDWGSYLIMTDLPKYMSDVRHFSIRQNGNIAAVMNLASFVVGLVSSWAADAMIQRNYMKILTQRKLYSLVASTFPAVGMILVLHFCEEKSSFIICMALCLSAFGFSFSSLKVNTLDLSPNYSATIMGMTNGAGCLSGMIIPYLVGVLTPNASVVEWQHVFYIVGAVMIFTNIIFLQHASADVQYWNDMEEYKETIAARSLEWSQDFSSDEYIS